MLSNLFRERAHLLGERCSLKRGGNCGRIRKFDTWLEVRIKLHFGRPRELVRVDEFLFETKRDLAGGAQCSSFYRSKGILATDTHGCTQILSVCIRVYPWLIALPRTAIIGSL